MDIQNHPCFNGKARHQFGRVHLPVAPRCNIKCNFCDRKHDCVSESRPGVTSAVLSPGQAMAYLDDLLVEQPNISVVGIAGPGDPFANPRETMKTLRMVREKYPEMLLCVATNGLELSPFIDELVELEVSHITVTLNAVHPSVGKGIYDWVRYGKRTYRGEEAASILLAKQKKAIERLAGTDIIVKINTVVVPGVNEQEVRAIGNYLVQAGVKMQNCIAFHPVAGTPFEDISEPSTEMMEVVRAKAKEYVPQMGHCQRCRADAAGMLEGAGCSTLSPIPLSKYAKLSIAPSDHRPFAAAVSHEGLLVNQHLGEASEFLIYKPLADGACELLERRTAPPSGDGARRWTDLSNLLHDCSVLLVGDAGPKPTQVLTESGIRLWRVEGMLSDLIPPALAGEDMTRYTKGDKFACGSGCSGKGTGCM